MRRGKRSTLLLHCLLPAVCCLLLPSEVQGEVSIRNVTVSNSTPSAGDQLTVTFEYYALAYEKCAYFAALSPLSTLQLAGTGGQIILVSEDGMDTETEYVEGGRSGPTCSYDGWHPSSDVDANIMMTIPASWPNGTYYCLIGARNWNTYCRPYDLAISGQAYASFTVVPPGPSPPTITQQPQSAEIAVGSPVTFSVTAIGNPAPTYQWRKDGTDITGATSATYTIPSVQASDEGDYTVLVSNGETPDAVSNAAALTVCIPPTITASPQNLTVLQGENAVFSVTATQSPSYQWQRYNGIWSNITTGGTSSTYTLQNASASADSGAQFRVRVTGCYTTLTSDVAVLIVNTGPSPPGYTKSPPDTAVAVGSAVTLSISAAGNPSPDHEWYFYAPGETVASSVGTGTSLSLPSASKSDSGYYYVVGTNTEGVGTSDTGLMHVIVPASIEVDLPDTRTVVKDASVTFGVGVTGEGSIRYQWYENDAAMSGETGAELSITIGDSAAYTGRTYYCDVWSSLSGMTVGGVTGSAVCTLIVSSCYNPFSVVATLVDEHNTADVILTLSGQNLEEFPTQTGFAPWAESVWVLYSTFGFPEDTTDDLRIVEYSIDALKAADGFELVDTLAVEPLPAQSDSFYYFSTTVVWKRLGEDDILLDPTNGNRLFMVDTLAPGNCLSITGSYIHMTDTVLLVVSGIAELDELADSVNILCYYKKDVDLVVLDTMIAVAVLKAAGGVDTVMVPDSAFMTVTDTLQCFWYAQAVNGIPGEEKSCEFTVGWARPVYAGTLSAENNDRSDRIQLTWNDPGDIDDVRIWYSADGPVPLGLPAESESFLAISVPDTLDPDTVMVKMSLPSAGTTYYFAVQVLKDWLWSVVTEDARCSGETAEWCGDMVENVLRVDTAWFDTITNELLVQWWLDDEGILSIPYYVSYSHGLDSSVITKECTNSTLQEVDRTKEKDTLAIPMAHSLVFDTTYYVGLWLSGMTSESCQGPPSAPGALGRTSARSHDPNWQIITYFDSDTTDTTATAFNGVMAIHWPKSRDTDPITDTLRACSIADSLLPDGLFSVGVTGFAFTPPATSSPKFTVALRATALPEGVSWEHLGLYRDSSGIINVVQGFERAGSVVQALVSSDELELPFLIFADTVCPRVTFDSDTSETILSGGTVHEEFTVSDNVGNVKWQYACGPGDGGYTDGGKSGLISGYSGIGRNTAGVRENYVSSGMRAIIVVDDGVHVDTVNVSRQAETSSTDKLAIPADEWTPLRPTGALSNPLPGPALKDIGEGWYDKAEVRVFRWYVNSPDVANSWLEYDPDKGNLQESFSLVPGRLLWIKLAEKQVVDLGPGLTTSLKDPVSITLRPLSWTDFALPFKFDVPLVEVLAATGTDADSLEFLLWEKGTTDKVYSAGGFYVPWLPDADDGQLLESAEFHDAYTVYNHKSDSVILRIPPIPPELSSIGVGKRAKKRFDGWDVRVEWESAPSVDAAMNRDAGEGVRVVHCAQANGPEASSLFGPMAPSFESAGAGVRCPASGALARYVLHRGGSDAGRVFGIVFYNNGDADAVLGYAVKGTETLPDGYGANLLNAATGTSVEPLGVVTVAPRSELQYTLAVGDASFMAGFATRFVAPALSLATPAPNPFAGRLVIRFSLPETGIRGARLVLFSSLGKRVWQVKTGSRAGVHRIVFDGRDNSGRPLAAGLYVLRMTALDTHGKLLRVGQHRVMCLK